MGTITFAVPDDLEEQFRQYAMERFGHKRRPIRRAGTEAISTWIIEQDTESSPSQNPLLTKQGHLRHVDAGSVDLQESVGKLVLEQHRWKRVNSR